MSPALQRPYRRLLTIVHRAIRQVVEAVKRADVVGERASLETLLGQVAEPFARRYAQPKTP